MSRPHMLTPPLGLPRGRTSLAARAASERKQLCATSSRCPRRARSRGELRPRVARAGILVQKRPLVIGWRATVIDEHLGRKTRLQAGQRIN